MPVKEHVVRLRGRRQRERLDKTAFKKPKTKVRISVWAMICKDYKSPLIEVPRTYTADGYIEHVLKPIVAPFFASKRTHNDFRYIFQEDNAGEHGLGSTLNAAADFKLQSNIKCLKPYWPSLSPDLSPIENIWRILKARVKRWRCQTEADLREKIWLEWQAITFEEVNKYHGSWAERIDTCIELNGNVTPY